MTRESRARLPPAPVPRYPRPMPQPRDITQPSHPISPDRCPECAAPFDCATNVDGPGAPEPGDWTVCIHCAAVLVFDEQLRHRLPTPAERADTPDEVLRAVKAIALVGAGRRTCEVARTRSKSSRMPKIKDVHDPATHRVYQTSIRGEQLIVSTGRDEPALWRGHWPGRLPADVPGLPSDVIREINKLLDEAQK